MGLQRREILIRAGKGGKVHITVLPLSLVQPLRDQMGIAHAMHEQDRAQGRAGVMLPYALERKYLKARSQLGCFGYFHLTMSPSTRARVSPGAIMSIRRRSSARSSGPYKRPN